jgi:hypothetical protein
MVLDGESTRKEVINAASASLRETLSKHNIVQTAEPEW